MNIIELARKILEDEGKELHFRVIAERALIIDKSIAEDVEACARKIGQALAAHINRHDKTPTSIFKRIKGEHGGFKSGMYGLIKRRAAPPPPPPPPQLPLPPIGPIPSSFIGKAGEYGVASELLYCGYNPAMLAVDHGVDIMALKDGQYFHIQVKTANERPTANENRSFTYKITKAIFEAHDNSKTFYVFVVRSNVNGRIISNYIILPSSAIRDLVNKNVITATRDISFNITEERNIFKLNGVAEERSTFKINGEYEVTGVNDFSRIR